jgi:hypothetical protein
MSDKHTIYIRGDSQRVYADRLIKDCPIGYTVTIQPETRSQAQNRMLWELVKDLRAQVPFMREHSPDDAKNILMNLAHDETRFLPKIDGGHFPVGQRSSLLSKKQFSNLIEVIFMYGAQNDVIWSKDTEKSLDDYKKIL